MPGQLVSIMRTSPPLWAGWQPITDCPHTESEMGRRDERVGPLSHSIFIGGRKSFLGFPSGPAFALLSSLSGSHAQSEVYLSNCDGTGRFREKRGRPGAKGVTWSKSYEPGCRHACV